MPFESPDTSDQFQVKDHVGSLALIAVNDFSPQFRTSFGTKDIVRCEVVLIEGPTAGDRYPDAMLFNSKMVPQLRGKVGATVLGRFALGEAKAGQNAPLILLEPTTADVEIANAWVKANGDVDCRPVDQLPPPPPQNGGENWQVNQQQQGNYQGQQGQQQPPPPPYPNQNQGYQNQHQGRPAASYAPAGSGSQEPPF